MTQTAPAAACAAKAAPNCWDDEVSYEPTPRTRAFEMAYQRTPRSTVLGRGAFGITYTVRPRSDPEQRLAAKEIPVGQLCEPKQRAALAESEILRTLVHPNVVTCVDSFLTSASLYIIMECATNGNLSRHILAKRESADGWFPEATILAVFAQLCSALAYVHRRKILHRDLKPANVFVFGTGPLPNCIVKLGDFGLGKAYDGITCAALSTVGSPSYFSPEICRSRPYGRKSDVWALGVLLYELVALALPFTARVVPAVARLICLTEPAPLPDHYSQELRALVAALLQKDPQMRPAAQQITQEPIVRQYIDGESSGLSMADSTAPASEADTSAPVSPESSSLCGRQLMHDKLVLHENGDPLSGSGVDVAIAVFRDHDSMRSGHMTVERLLQVFLQVSPSLSRGALEELLVVADGRCGDSMDYERLLEWIYR